MKKTYLVGYYGMQNTGDDALLAATVWGSRQYLNTGAFTVNTPCELKIPGYGLTPPILVHRQSVPAHNRVLQYKAALYSNQVIFGGGSVLQNARDIDLKRDLLTLAGGNNHLALGVGVGPFETWSAERSCKKLLEKCRFVGVRDPISLDVATAIAPKANVQMTFDLAPSLLARDDFTLMELERRGIAVCLCPWERLKGEINSELLRNRRLARALETISLETGEPIVFLDFNGHESLGDRTVHREVADMMDPSVEKKFVPYDQNPLRVLQRMASFKAVVSMRLHASIFGFMAKTPVVSLNYHQKCAGWCDLVGMPRQYRFGLDAIEECNLIEPVVMGLSRGFQDNSLQVNDAVEKSLLNWSQCYVQNHIGSHSAL